MELPPFNTDFWASSWPRPAEQKLSVNNVPDKLPRISETEHRLLSLYLEEWKTAVAAQKHLTTLVLRLRLTSMIVFAFLTAGAVVARKSASLSLWEFRLSLLVPAILWIMAMVLDICYYSRLLQSVQRHFEKFDRSSRFQVYGLFGMYSSLNSFVPRKLYERCLAFYYALPLVLALYIALRNNLIPRWLLP